MSSTPGTIVFPAPIDGMEAPTQLQQFLLPYADEIRIFYLCAYWGILVYMTGRFILVPLYRKWRSGAQSL